MKSYISIALMVLLVGFSVIRSCSYPIKPAHANAINASAGSSNDAHLEDKPISDTVVCLAGLLIFLFFLYRLFLAGRDIKHAEDSTPRSFAEAVDGFRKSRSKGETLFLIFLCSPMFVRYTFFAMFASVATAGFTALAGICGLSPEALRVIFEGIDRILIRIEQILKGL